MPRKINQEASPSRKLLGLFSLLLFSGEWYSLPDLAQIFKCSKQTISRLLEEIELSHEAKIERETRSRTCFYRICAPKKQPHVSLTPAEISQLVLCRDLVMHLLPDDLRASVARTIRQTTVLLPEPEQRCQAMDSCVQVSVRGHIDYTPFHGFLDSLLQSIREKRVCEIEYLAASRDQPKLHEIAPMRIIAYREALYVSAWKVTPKGTPEPVHPMLLALHRFKSVTPTRRTFNLPLPPSEAEGLFGLMPQEPFKARIRFDRSVAPYIRERRWSTEQSLTAQEDGGVILELAARSEAELMSWVLSFGTHAELISPQHMRHQLIQSLSGAKELYQECEVGAFR